MVESGPSPFTRSRILRLPKSKTKKLQKIEAMARRERERERPREFHPLAESRRGISISPFRNSALASIVLQAG